MRIHYEIKSRLKSEELRFFLIFFILHSSFFIFSSCEHDDYDKGDGRYSHLRTDYVTVSVQDNYVQSITTDEGVALPFSTGMKVDVQPKDTTLRWLIYYNQNLNPNTNQAIEIMERNTMMLLKPIDRMSLATVKTDPVTLTSAWMASNGKYLNMRLGLKISNPNLNSNKQTIALVNDGENDGVVYYTLYHDQADSPQYYTQEYYFTVNASEGKEIDLTINTYNGTWHKRF